MNHWWLFVISPKVFSYPEFNSSDFSPKIIIIIFFSLLGDWLIQQETTRNSQ